jgi:hypothetical protein
MVIGVVAVVLILIGLVLLLSHKGGIISPLPENSGIRIIFASPHPSVAALPSPSASASASLKPSAKPKATATPSPKASP